jgi:kynureninase
MRARFVLTPDEIYLNGNSLGALPRTVASRLAEVVEREWGESLARSWTAGSWFSAPERVGDKIAAIIGARPGEVLACDSTTIVLAKLLAGALRARPGRKVILTTSTNFPTDLYAARGVARLLGSAEVRCVEPAALVAELDETVAVLSLTHVDVRTGEMFDLPGLTAAAHEAGALALWDLSHSAGAVVVGCDEHGVDLAVGCGYKYLNGGPGAPAFLYVREEHQDMIDNPLPGWLGHEAPFDMSLDYRPASGIRRFLTSTPAILGLSALEAALDCWGEVTIEQVRRKSVQLSELFIAALEERLPGVFELASPREPERRGSQVSLRHPEARMIVAALAERGVIGDFRVPDVCRLGFGALYLSFTDAFAAAERLVAVMESGAFRQARFARAGP